MDEKVRANMFKLRTTWDGVFPEECLNQLDIGVNQIDRAWPIKSAMVSSFLFIYFSSDVAPAEKKCFI